MPEPRDDTGIFDRSFKLIIGSLSNRALIIRLTARSDGSIRSR
jgi:hypothetical protein